MSTTPTCILRIRQSYPNLAGKYREIADLVLAHPERIVSDKVSQIARACTCDDAQVIRFCKKIGYEGYKDMRSSLAKEFMPAGMGSFEEDVKGTAFEKLRAGYRNNLRRVLDDTVGLFDEKEIGRAVASLKKARGIYLLGGGASGVVATDAQFKLQRLGFNAIRNPDSDMNRMLCGLIGAKDVVIAFSFTGETRGVCELAAHCRKAGAKVIAITNFPKSTLAKKSDIVLLTASQESTFRLGAMTSRIAQLLVVDFLIINLALKDMRAAEDNVVRTHRMVDEGRS